MAGVTTCVKVPFWPEHNTEVNVGLAQVSVNMARDQTVSAIWIVRKTEAENVEQDGETVFSECQREKLMKKLVNWIHHSLDAIKIRDLEIFQHLSRQDMEIHKNASSLVLQVDTNTSDFNTQVNAGLDLIMESMERDQ